MKNYSNNEDTVPKSLTVYIPNIYNAIVDSILQGTEEIIIMNFLFGLLSHL